MNAIFTRVSVRKWQDTPVEPHKLERILRAAMAAPSAGNQQPWQFYIVRGREMLEKLSQISEYAGCMAGAKLAIVNVCDASGCRFPQVAPLDLAACTENEWLQAADEGLGAVWIGVAPFADRVARVNELLALPKGQEAFSILALGYPGVEKTPKDRYDPSRIHEAEGSR